MDSLFTLFAAAPCAEKSFFGLWPWYHYLNVPGKMDGACNILNFTFLGSNGSKSDLLLVSLAVVDDLLRIAGLVAVGYVIYAGIKYVISQGAPEETAKAKSTLLNAIIGLAIALVAVALVSFVGNKIGGAPVGPGGAVAGQVDVGSLPNTAATGATVKVILSIVFGIVGALSLLFITIGGFRYVISQGDPQTVSKAKNTILYAIIGLVVAISAQAIVTFIVGKV
jgi:hypothetical protein